MEVGHVSHAAPITAGNECLIDFRLAPPKSRDFFCDIRLLWLYSRLWSTLSEFIFVLVRMQPSCVARFLQ